MKFTKILSLIFAMACCIAFGAPELYAQKNCGTDAYQEELMQDPEYRQRFELLNAHLAELIRNEDVRSRAGGLVIPIAVHYDNSFNSSDMICLREAAKAQIAVLNADFNAQNADIADYEAISAACSNSFPLSALSTGIDIEFVFATNNHPTSAGLAEGQFAITIGQHKYPSAGCDWSGYMNIFVESGVVEDNFIGLAPLAGAASPDGNGIKILSTVFGGPGIDCSSGYALNNHPDNNLGRTGTHEAGHYFGLEHTFFGSCSAAGDGIADTPSQANGSNGVPMFDWTLCYAPTAYSCGSPDFYMNYMDVSNDEALVMFTTDQATVMCGVAMMGTWKTGTTGGSTTNTIPFELASMQLTDSSCDADDGSVTFNLVGGITGPISPFTITYDNEMGNNGTVVGFSNGSNFSIEITDLAVGEYTYTITNGNCTIEGTFVIENDFSAIAVSTDRATCDGINDGMAEIEFLGGDPSLDYTIEYVNTSGAGDGYDEYFWPAGPESVELTDLAVGDWTYVATNGICEYSGTFKILGDFEATAVPQHAATCNGTDGTADIEISGGDPSQDYVIEYVHTSGNGDGADEYFFPSGEGIMYLSELSGGYWTYTITNGDCILEGDFEIEQLDDPADGVDCDAFNAIWAVPSMANSNGYWTKTVVSSVHAAIKVELGGAVIPDGVRVTVTNAQGSTYSEYWTAGTHKCDGFDYNGDPTGDYECRVFGIAPCDKVRFEVFTDVCKLDKNSAWNFNVYCGKDFNNDRCSRYSDGKYKEVLTELDKLEQSSPIVIAANKARFAESLQVFPSPVSAVINVINNDARINYTAVRVLDVSGRILLSKDMSNRTELSIDVKALKAGMYFVEIQDDNGQKVVHKILKVN